MSSDGAIPGRSERARQLVLRYGWNATSYQILNPGIALWFSSQRDAVIGYVRRNRRRIVAGAPVCSDQDLAAVVEEWESESARQGDRVCYFGAAGRLEALLAGQPGYSTVLLGSQQVWEPADWPRIVAGRSSIRAQLNRAVNKNVRVSEWAAEESRDNQELGDCLAEWLSNRGLPPLHFLVEPQTLNRTEDRRIFVAERSSRVIAFLVMSPITCRKGWLTEQFPRRRSAPNGTVELLIDTAMRALGGSGAEHVTMGLVPLATAAASTTVHNPLWLSLLTTWVRAHGRRFYDFEGLERFKSKLHPGYWEPIYAISNERRFSPRTLFAVAAAFTGGPPLLAMLKGMGRAARQEWEWLRVRPPFDRGNRLR